MQAFWACASGRRATFDRSYGRYTWGKLELLKLRERARKDWGPASRCSASTRR